MLKVKNALRVLCEDGKERVVVFLYEIDIGLSSLGQLRMKKGMVLVWDRYKPIIPWTVKALPQLAVNQETIIRLLDKFGEF